MRHRKANNKLGHSGEHRRAILRNLATSLITHGRIRTTDAKAKQLRPYAERLVTMAKKQTVDARRRAAQKLYNKDAVRKLFDVYAERFASRPGGYTRIIKEGNRPGDNASMSIIEFVDNDAAVTEHTEAAEE